MDLQLAILMKAAQCWGGGGVGLRIRGLLSLSFSELLPLTKTDRTGPDRVPALKAFPVVPIGWAAKQFNPKGRLCLHHKGAKQVYTVKA